MKKERRQKIRTNLRPVTDWMCYSSHIIEKCMKICDACRKQFKVQKVIEEQDCSVPAATRTNTAGPRHKDEGRVCRLRCQLRAAFPKLFSSGDHFY
jgi:hypothetical protein